MPIISILNPKGGSGKTTITTNLARSLHERGHKVLIVDSDPQGSARDWHAANEENPLPLVALDRANNVKSLPNVAAAYDFVMVDGAAKLEDMIAASIKITDFVFIPVTPSPYDLWASAEMVNLIREAQVFRPTLRAAFAINRRVSTTVIGREARGALADQPLPALQAEVRQRIVFAESVAAGRLARELAPDSAAAREVSSLVDELLRWSS